MTLLEVDRLSLAIAVGGMLKPVVDEISFTLQAGHTLGIVGESGCGKSLTSLAIMGLLDGSPIRVTGGAIRFEGQDLLKLGPRARRVLMGSRMAMIFQEPMTSLNPVYPIGRQITEMLHQHQSLSAQAARERTMELLQLVRIPDPESRLTSYPHQLSGGQRQRVMIAMALACNPDLLIADEPTTALDVTVQAQILDLLNDLQQQNRMAVILISHDLGVIAENCQHVAVMYRGRIVEAADTVDLFEHPRHPYTRGLMASIPDPDHDHERLQAIPGRVPTIDETISGCAFHPRCPNAGDRCKSAMPDATGPANHPTRCHFPYESVR